MNPRVTENMSMMQSAGRKKRSPVDNIIVTCSIMERNRTQNKLTYMMFVDAVKCFDKLWLKDGMLELERNGMPEHDVMMIYEMNKTSNIVVKTPNGVTDQFTTQNTVKQGTTFGSIICCAETDRVNEINERVAVLYGPKLEIGMPVFMEYC